jgi:hypothetical protein
MAEQTVRVRSAPRIAYQDRVDALDLQTSTAQLLDDSARQGLDIASRVLLDRCDNDALGLLSRIGQHLCYAETGPDR